MREAAWCASRTGPMRLADFILAHIEPILAEWEAFARSLLPGAAMNPLALRDHAEDILRATARDMASPQNATQKSEKSKGRDDEGDKGCLNEASHVHAIGRVGSGFKVTDVISEYRALRPA